MKQLMTTALILVCGVALVGCADRSDSENEVPGTEPNVSESNNSPSSGSPTTPNSETLEIQGTVVYKDLEGGFFAIDGDDGQKYNPVNLSESFRKDGLKVKVTARPNADAMTVHMYGTVVEIVEIQAAGDQP